MIQGLNRNNHRDNHLIVVTKMHPLVYEDSAFHLDSYDIIPSYINSRIFKNHKIIFISRKYDTIFSILPLIDKQHNCQRLQAMQEMITIDITIDNFLKQYKGTQVT